MARLIHLTQGKDAVVDDEDYPDLAIYAWCADKQGHVWYAARTEVRDGKKRTVSMHRMIMGFPPKPYVTDHRDGDGLNNQRDNLRICTPRQNAQNRQKYVATSSRYKGVSWHKPSKTWGAYIGINGKFTCLGYRNSEEDAHQLYVEAALYHFHEFANPHGVPQHDPIDPAYLIDTTWRDDDHQIDPPAQTRVLDEYGPALRYPSYLQAAEVLRPVRQEQSVGGGRV